MEGSLPVLLTFWDACFNSAFLSCVALAADCASAAYEALTPVKPKAGSKSDNPTVLNQVEIRPLAGSDDELAVRYLSEIL